MPPVPPSDLCHRSPETFPALKHEFISGTNGNMYLYHDIVYLSRDFWAHYIYVFAVVVVFFYVGISVGRNGASKQRRRIDFM